MKYFDNADKGKWVFLLVLPFFLWLELYGVFNPAMRLCFEGASDMVLNPAYGFISYNNRYSYILNKFMVQPAFWMHLPLHTVSTIYCLNDLIFYLLIAALIIICTGQYVYAAVVLAGPVLIHGQFYYYMVNEIFLSGAMMVFFVAVYKYMPDGIWRKIFLLIGVYYVIWGHPFNLYMLFLFAVALYTGFAQIRAYAWLVIFALANLAARIMHFTVYNAARFSVQQNRLHQSRFSFSGFFCQLGDTIAAYAGVYWFILILLCILFVTAANRKERTVAWLAAASLSGTWVLQALIFPSAPWGQDFDITKLIYPTHLFILSFGLPPLVNKISSRKLVLALLLVFTLTIGVRQVVYGSFNNHMKKHIALIRQVNAMCAERTPASSKWFIRTSNLPWRDQVMNSGYYSEPLYFSGMDNNNHIVAVVFLPDSMVLAIFRTPQDAIHFAYNFDCAIVSISNFYYPIKQGPYLEFTPDSAQLDQLNRINEQP